MRVAVLDPRKRLINTRTVKSAKPDDIDAGDLPADGSYWWNGQTFIPVGFGAGKPQRPEVDRDRAVYLMMRAMLDGTPVPHECRAWCDWYARHHGAT